MKPALDRLWVEYLYRPQPLEVRYFYLDQAIRYHINRPWTINGMDQKTFVETRLKDASYSADTKIKISYSPNPPCIFPMKPEWKQWSYAVILSP